MGLQSNMLINLLKFVSLYRWQQIEREMEKKQSKGERVISVWDQCHRHL